MPEKDLSNSEILSVLRTLVNIVQTQDEKTEASTEVAVSPEIKEQIRKSYPRLSDSEFEQKFRTDATLQGTAIAAQQTLNRKAEVKRTMGCEIGKHKSQNSTLKKDQERYERAVVEAARKMDLSGLLQ